MRTLTASRNRDSRNVSQVTAVKKFGRYKDETEKAVREAAVKKSNVIQKLKKLWANFVYTKEPDPLFKRHLQGLPLDRKDPEYHHMVEPFARLKYSAKDVEDFCFIIPEFQDESNFAIKAGIFLSVLVDYCKDSDFVIHTGHLSDLIESLGTWNTKNIIVKGDVGYATCWYMSGGSMIIQGDGCDNIGFAMSGGTIIINGDLKGKPFLLGDYLLGNAMTGGVIHLNGEVLGGGGDHQNLWRESALHGRIYHKGKLIVDK